MEGISKKYAGSKPKVVKPRVGIAANPTKSMANRDGMSKDEAEAVGRMIAKQLMAGNWGGAREVLSARIKQHQAEPEPIMLTTHLADARDRLPERWIDNRTLTMLEANGYLTVGDLLHESANNLMRLEYFGVTVVERIVQAGAYWARELTK